MASIIVSGDTSGAVTLAAPAVAGTTTLTLPTTTGTLVVTSGAQTIEFAAGTVSAPAITTTGDTNTGIFFPAADTIAFTEGGAEAMRIDSSGNVGIGTSSPNEKLGVAGAIATTSNASNFNQAKFLMDYNSGSGRLSSYASGGSTIEFYTNASGGNVAERMRITSAGNVGIGTSSPAVKLDFGDTSVGTQLINLRKNGNSVIGIGVNAGYGVRLAGPSDADSPVSMGTISTSDGSTFTERMRIDSSGNLLVGTATPNSGEKIYGFTNSAQNVIGGRLGASGNNATIFLATNATGASSFDYFGAYNGVGTKIAGILSTGTFQSATNTYGGTSDERLKENITDATPKLNDLLNVRIRNFNFKADEQKLKQIGVIAQELEEVFPALVEDTPTWNENNESTGTVKNVKYSVFVPMLIKAIQEQQAIIEELKARIETLETK